MASSENIKDILSKVKDLNQNDQISLLERLAKLIRKTQGSSSPLLKLTSLSGLGSEVWKDINIGEYLDGERQW